MDMGMLRPIVEQLFQGKDRVSKQEVQSKGQSLGLPQDKIQSLPDKDFSKDELLQHLGGDEGFGDLGDLGRKIA